MSRFPLSLSLVVGVVFEGIPFFGDILLRLPKITKDVCSIVKHE